MALRPALAMQDVFVGGIVLVHVAHVGAEQDLAARGLEGAQLLERGADQRIH